MSVWDSGSSEPPSFASVHAPGPSVAVSGAANRSTCGSTSLNGSALALPRIVASLLENNQTPEGIRIPEALRPYTGFDLIN